MKVAFELSDSLVSRIRNHKFPTGQTLNSLVQSLLDDQIDDETPVDDNTPLTPEERAELFSPHSTNGPLGVGMARMPPTRPLG